MPTDFGPKLSKEQRLAPATGQEIRPAQELRNVHHGGQYPVAREKRDEMGDDVWMTFLEIREVVGVQEILHLSGFLFDPLEIGQGGPQGSGFFRRQRADKGQPSLR